MLRFASRVKYLRTIVTELTYLPLLMRELGRADVVHVFSASYSSFLLAPLPAMAIARALGRPVVLNYRSGQAPDHLTRSAVARAAIAAADLNVVPSGFLAEVFAGFGIDAAVIPNIVDTTRFAFRLRDQLTPRLLSTRSFEPLYNVACTLRAFRIVQQRVPDAALTLIGGGSQQRALEQLAVELDVKHVTFAGRVAPGRIADYYAAHDIYVQSPDIDNMPSSILEAYASGLPVVSTRAGGVPAILEDGTHGLLAELDDHEAIAAHVLTLLDDAPLARSVACAGRAAVESCTWPAVRQQWLHLYHSALASRVTHAAPATSHDAV